MTRVLLDTNVVLRLLEKDDPQHGVVRAAVDRCVASGLEPCLAPQVVVEFWVVATRPREANGLGWDPPAARAAVDGLVSLFPMLPDAPGAFTQWLRLVTDGLVRGKRAHDVRLAAAALSNGIGAILTLNPADFADVPGLAVLRVSTSE